MLIDGISPTKRNVVKAMARDPLFFMRTVAPWIYTHPFGAVHRAIMRDLPDTYSNSTAFYREITQIRVPRGYAKSMLVTVGWVLWQAIFKGKRHIPISSVDGDTSENFLSTIAFVVEGDAFKFYFGDCVGETWNKSERILRSDTLGLHTRIASYGVGQSVVGLNWLGKRPDLWVFDDIENEKTVMSAKVIDDRENWIYTVVMPALQGSTCPVVFIGTPYAADCVLLRVGNNKKMVRVVEYPALVETERQARRLGVPIGESIWEEKKPTQKIIEERDKWAEGGKLQNWNLAFMLKASCAKVKGFDPSNINEFDSDVLRNKDLAYYILCDFAYSKKASADPAAIAVMAIDTSDRNKMYVIESDEGQWGDVATIERICNSISKYAMIAKSSDTVLTVGVESYSFQMVRKLIYESLGMVDMRNVSVIELVTGGRSKVSRMQALIPYCETGRFYIHHNATALRGQMLRFDGLSDRKLNLLDACAYILDFLFKREPQKTPGEIKHEAWLEIEEMLDGDSEENGIYSGLAGCVEDECF